VIKPIRALGRSALNFTQNLGMAGLFLAHTLIALPQPRTQLPLIAKQIHQLGVLSLMIVVVSALFIGMVMALQGYTLLARYGSQSVLGQMLALSLLRELGPVVAALLFAGRAGSALTAEIGLMKATEQLASLEMMGVDPLRRIIAPRFWAGVLCMPVLACVFSAVGIVGGYLVGVDWLGVHAEAFWSNMQSTVSFREDVVNGLIKSLVFGIVITWIAVYQGYATVPTAAGISQATTRTVVTASLAILGLDFVLTAMMFTDF
jgi:phospholipid/cholesterol/gamma-HCH transport system permease protein